MNKNWLQGVVGFGLALLAVATRADELNMTQGVTAISRAVYDLHMLIFWVCVVSGIGVFGMMAWSLINHRKSRGHAAAQFHESTQMEILWTLTPVLILIGMAFPATQVLIQMYDTGGEGMKGEVGGYHGGRQDKKPGDDYNSTLRLFSHPTPPHG